MGIAVFYIFLLVRAINGNPILKIKCDTSIIASINAMLRTTELKVIEASKRDGTYVVDKNTVHRLVNLVKR